MHKSLKIDLKRPCKFIVEKIKYEALKIRSESLNFSLISGII